MSLACSANGCRLGCLIFQRPHICSTTSLESIRTSTRVAPSSAAARSPSISPVYSATLLVVTPWPPLRAATTRSPSASRSTAPYPAGPGCPRDPRSASTITCTWSQPRFSGAHQDRAAVVTRHDCVRVGGLDLGQRHPVQLELTRPAPPGPQQTRAPAARLSHPVVQLQQLRGQLVDQLRPVRLALLLGLRHVPQRRLRGGAGFGDRTFGGLDGLGRLALVDRDGFPLLHQLEQVVLQRLLPPLQRADLVLEIGQLLGGDRAGGHQL